MLQRMNGDRPLAGLRVPVAWHVLLFLVRAITGLPDEVDRIASALFRFAFAERIDDIVEMTPDDDPRVSIVDGHGPSRDAHPMEELLGLGLLQKTRDLSDIRQPYVI